LKAESNTMPNGAFKIEKRGALADISFFENVSAIKEEDILTYEYDHYLLVVPFREGLEGLISSDYERWIESARSEEVEKPYKPSVEERISTVEVTTSELIDTLAIAMGVI